MKAEKTNTGAGSMSEAHLNFDQRPWVFQGSIVPGCLIMRRLDDAKICTVIACHIELYPGNWSQLTLTLLNDTCGSKRIWTVTHELKEFDDWWKIVHSVRS